MTNQARVPKTFKLNPVLKALNPVLNRMARAGVMGEAEVLTVRGRSSGEPRSTAVNPSSATESCGSWRPTAPFRGS